MVAYPTPLYLAVPYRVIGTWGTYSIVDLPPCSLMVFLPPLYNLLSNKQGIGVENLFTYGLV
jgi:hypothetical protein